MHTAFAAGLAAADGCPPGPRLPRQACASTGEILGSVRDPAGLAVAGVKIELRNGETGAASTLISSGDGIFRVAGVAPGHYTVRAAFDSGPISQALSVEAGSETNVVLVAAALPQTETRRLPGAPAGGGSSRFVIRPQDEMEPVQPAEAPLPPADKVFVPVANRWNYQWPEYQRYGRAGDFPYAVQGHWWDPFHRNKLKGDQPIFGKQIFLNLSLVSETTFDARRLPPKRENADAFSDGKLLDRFGQGFLSEVLTFSADLFHGDTSYKPFDWRVKVTPAVNVNYLAVRLRGNVNVDPAAGTTRLDSHAGLQEAFAEFTLKSLSRQYDFVATRVGIQNFTSDFRGFLFSDSQPAVRVFGNLRANRYQYNAAWFTLLEKDTNSGLNTFAGRQQQVFVANLYRQDFLTPGYTAQFSFHYNKDDASSQLDTNGFRVRPSPIGNGQDHAVRAYYLGWSGDGHIGRVNLTHAFYQALGHDTFNAFALRPVEINAQMAAAEVSYDFDWLRLRGAFLFASGDSNPKDGTARGFDAIVENPVFAGGIFSLWAREGLPLTGKGVASVGGSSLLPSLRPNRTQGQANFVNPGLLLYNAGLDADLRPNLRAFANLNMIRFDHPEPLQLMYGRMVHPGAGADSGLGVTYRPAISENMTVSSGVNVFSAFQGFRDIYSVQTFASFFANVRFRF